MDKQEVIARELCKFYRKARQDENANYCNYATIESYLESSWMHFKEEAQSLIELLNTSDEEE